jgi:hypothetical protein
MFLAGFYLTTQLLKITRGWEVEGLEKEANLPLGCPRKPSGYCICQRHLKKGTVVKSEDLRLGMGVK